ncbi:17-beta-hydroxysteroid dehydrogenase 13-like isoform X1 [Topomyia yanbarensis]|uniref:17-beta-hydroxysteroid dehydrogenase 13-like isoform X1 n=2 Tax=Topomyia yanbarensis TaxID=2498891 RepID=UPI00273ACDB2|nr:17-beta-hydroxysteroid dehydrogenase 13-like isoform X1 [Topomyia yanbarensis]XP_058826105.1 17-beta-hydroxysteroid dehydrogenase 13-like isoform X1 [Topomyia yanbarensis]
MSSRKVISRNDTSYIPNWLEYHKKPISMILRLYSSFILFWDFCIILIYFALQLLRSLYQLVKPPKRKSVAGEIVAIFGTSRGVGRDLALQLAEHGAKVACVDINSTDNDVLVKNINSSGYIAHAFECDVTNKNDVIRTTNAIEKKFGPISMLFHCCGVPSPRSLIKEAPTIQATLELSVVSHFWLLEAILPKMKRHNHGHIVFLTSVAGLSGVKHQTPLSVAQFAVQGLFESVLDELRIEKFHKTIHTSLVHLYPFVITPNCRNDIRMRIPSAFGTIPSEEAARRIIDGVRRNKLEISIPKYLLLLGHVVRLLPRRATLLLRELFDTGVEF